jgi:hypothetical protein
VTAATSLDPSAFFVAYATAVADRDLDAVAAAHDVPAVLLGGVEPVVVTDRSRIAELVPAFLDAGERGEDEAVAPAPEVQVLDDGARDALWVSVRWATADGGPGEVVRYLLRATVDGLRILVVAPADPDDLDDVSEA